MPSSRSLCKEVACPFVAGNPAPDDKIQGQNGEMDGIVINELSKRELEESEGSHHEIEDSEASCGGKGSRTEVFESCEVLECSAGLLHNEIRQEAGQKEIQVSRNEEQLLRLTGYLQQVREKKFSSCFKTKAMMAA